MDTDIAASRDLRRRLAFNLRLLMATKRLSVKGLATAAGLSRQALYPILRCEQSLTLDRLANLAAAFHCDAAELLHKPVRSPSCGAATPPSSRSKAFVTDLAASDAHCDEAAASPRKT